MPSLLSLLISAVLAVAAAFAGFVFAVYLIRRLLFSSRHDVNKCTIGFFHPYCNSGGGGERVLWCAIAALAGARDVRNLKVVVYCGDDPSKTSVDYALEDVKRRFGIAIPPELDVEFVFIKGRHLLEPQRYPRFTMLGQSLGSMVVAWECLRVCNPDVWVDTTGYAFTYILAKLFAACTVACYVHYPTITTDMLAAVHERRPSHNNKENVSGSIAATRAKLLYYKLFAAAYRFAGGFTDAIMVNSTWTKDHLVGLWRLPGYRDPSSAVISKRGQGTRPAMLESTEGEDGDEDHTWSRSTLRGGSHPSTQLRPAPTPRLSNGGSDEEDGSKEHFKGATRRSDQRGFFPASSAWGGPSAEAGISAPASFSVSSSETSLAASVAANDGGETYRPVGGIVASLIRASGLRPHFIPLLSFFLASSGSGGTGTDGIGDDGGSGGIGLISIDPVEQAAKPLQHANSGEGSFSSSLSYLERPAARVVYPPCNTDALAIIPLGWGYNIDSGSNSARKSGEIGGRGAVGPRSTASNKSSGDSSSQQKSAETEPAFSTTRQRIIVSVAQFRPEKDHALQILSFSEFIKRDPISFADVRLVLVGGVRDDGDRQRLQALQQLAESDELALPKGSVEFRTNIPLTELRRTLGTAVAGLHSMWNEHFGIGVVEMMAAGVLTIAHNSGGPKSDIIVPYCGAKTGFLASTSLQYADALETIFRPISSNKNPAKDEGGYEHESAERRVSALSSCALPTSSLFDFDPLVMATAARASVTSRFSDEEFSLCFFAVMAGVLQDGLEAAAKRRLAVTGSSSHKVD